MIKLIYCKDIENTNSDMSLLTHVVIKGLVLVIDRNRRGNEQMHCGVGGKGVCVCVCVSLSLSHNHRLLCLIDPAQCRESPEHSMSHTS